MGATTGSDSARVVAIAGDLDLVSVPRFRADIDRALTEPGTLSLALDFAEATSLDSSGLGLLVWTREACLTLGVPLRLHAMPDRLQRVIVMTDMVELFDFDGGLTIDRGSLSALPAETPLPAEPDHKFDKMAALTRRVLDVPTAMVSLVDRRQQVFPGAAGLPEPWQQQRSTPLSHSFCQYVVAGAAPLVVEDARADARVEGNAAITELGVISYAGMPIVDLDGNAVGSLCVVDHRPRVWTDSELDTLTDLAAACSAELQLRAAISRTAVTAERDRMAQHLQREVFGELLRLTMVVGNARSTSVGRAAQLLDETLEGLDHLAANLRSTLFERAAAPATGRASGPGAVAPQSSTDASLT